MHVHVEIWCKIEGGIGHWNCSDNTYRKHEIGLIVQGQIPNPFPITMPILSHAQFSTLCAQRTRAMMVVETSIWA